MKLLLKQQQRVLLGISDVSGWGAFLKNSVSKHEYLGEYTGELISHKEADKRGKIYDRENCSFLFNLNDQARLSSFEMSQLSFSLVSRLSSNFKMFLDCAAVCARCLQERR
jgi:SET domain-containing protein